MPGTSPGMTNERASPPASLLTSGPSSDRSAHQPERIGEKLRTAKIAGLQRQQHLAVLDADGTQHRNACGDFSTDQKAGNPQAIHYRPGRFAAGDDQPPHTGIDQPLGDVGHRLLDRMARSIAAM